METSKLAEQNPHPDPLPEYREREKEPHAIGHFDTSLWVQRLVAMQAAIRDVVIASRLGTIADSASVSRVSSADTIYAIDAQVDPVLESFCIEWSRSQPLVLISEGGEGEDGREGIKVFPTGAREADATVRLLVDPIDGTRGIMYDKRSAWSLAAVAPNLGPATRLRDAQVSVMTELPTSKMGEADVLWASRGKGAAGKRMDLSTGASKPLALRPSSAAVIDHGFASVSNFFPGTKRLASDLMESIAGALIGPADVTRATVFDDQYISTGGQWYELIVGHDRFNADLRPVFYRLQNQPEGLCCHPYDCGGLLIAEEAGVIITDEMGKPLDAPMDVTTGVSWIGYANNSLREAIEPLIGKFLEQIKR